MSSTSPSPLRTALLDGFRYDAWANARAAAALLDAPADPRSARATGLFAHLARASAVWLGRVRGTTDATLPLWETDAVADAADRAAEAAAAWRRYLRDLADADFLRPVAYANTRGEAFATPLHEIAAHVVAHGAYHRGQIALLLRQAGAEPPVTDRIAWARAPERRLEALGLGVLLPRQERP